MAATTNITVGGASVTVGSSMGYIKDGVTLTPTLELFTVDGIEQLLTPSRAWRVSEQFECQFTTVEPTQANIKIALDCDNTWTGTPPALKFGDNQFSPANDTAYVVVMTGYTAAATQYVRTITLHRCFLSTPAPIKFTKGQETNLAMTFLCCYEEDTDVCVGTISDATS